MFNSSGGLTKDHCEYLRRRLASCISHREERYKDFIHATKGIHEKQIEDMKDSIRLARRGVALTVHPLACFFFTALVILDLEVSVVHA